MLGLGFPNRVSVRVRVGVHYQGYHKQSLTDRKMLRRRFTVVRRSFSPPRVAETRKWVPYFLMRFSLICCRVGRRPSNRRLRRNSGASGNGARGESLFSVTKLLTFQWLNSLSIKIQIQGIIIVHLHLADAFIQSDFSKILKDSRVNQATASSSGAALLRDTTTRIKLSTLLLQGYMCHTYFV